MSTTDHATTTTTMMQRFDALDRLLVDETFTPTATWWRDTLRRFYASDAKQLVLRVGRRGGKSSTLCRIGVLEALYGDHKIPLGDLGIVGIVSVDRREATKRIRTIVKILNALKVPHHPVDGGIELDDRPIAFLVASATVGAVVGGTWICAICDEVSRWRDADSGANPATEVLASLRPSLATMPNARIFLSSSPWSTEDAHARAFDAGDDDFQIVAHAESWVANPTLTEEKLRASEPNQKLFDREYRAIPQTALSSAFDPHDVRAAVRSSGPFITGSPPLGLLDASAGRGDSYVCVIAQRFKDDKGISRIRIGAWGGFDGRILKGWTTRDVLKRMAHVAKEKANVTHFVSDSFGQFEVTPTLAEYGITHTTLEWSPQSKLRAVEIIRAWLRNGDLFIEPCEDAEKWVREMNNFQEVLLPSGFTSFSGRHGGHDDRVACLINLAIADSMGLFSKQTAPIVAGPVTIPNDDGAGFDHIVTPNRITGPSGYVAKSAASNEPDPLGFTQHPSVLIKSVDDYVEGELRKDARQNAGPNDHAPGYSLVEDKKRNDFGDF